MTRVPLGRLCATPGALRAAETVGQVALLELVRRHATGDWGELSADDWRANERALRDGTRLLSAYRLSTGVRVWIITEWDRSLTTILLPSEY